MQMFAWLFGKSYRYLIGCIQCTLDRVEVVEAENKRLVAELERVKRFCDEVIARRDVYFSPEGIWGLQFRRLAKAAGVCPKCFNHGGAVSEVNLLISRPFCDECGRSNVKDVPSPTRNDSGLAG